MRSAASIGRRPAAERRSGHQNRKMGTYHGRDGLRLREVVSPVKSSVMKSAGEAPALWRSAIDMEVNKAPRSRGRSVRFAAPKSGHP